MTFFCERQSISKILDLAATNYSGSIQDISDVTGIPTGKSTGKVKPHIDYACGMGLIEYQLDKGVYKLRLSPFGTVVKKSDPFLEESITQWLAHANLCDPVNGAIAWTTIFTNWTTNEYRSEDQISLISEIPKLKLRPLFQMYERKESFGKIGALRRDDDGLRRVQATISYEWNRGFAALVLSLLERYFHSNERKQISIPEFIQVTKFPYRFHWQVEEFYRAVQNLTSLGYIRISNLVDPPVIQSLVSSEQVWGTIYDDIV
jgi:hypothetical protein